jgi:hypothetical protein
MSKMTTHNASLLFATVTGLAVTNSDRIISDQQLRLFFVIKLYLKKLIV